MKIKALFCILATCFTGCASPPLKNLTNVVPAPDIAKNFEAELAKIISPSHCRILGCVRIEKDSNHFICTGEFSLILRSRAQKNFISAASKVFDPKMRIDFTAEQGLGSQMLMAFLGGVGSGLGAGVSGSSGSPFYYIGGTTSSPVQFTLPQASAL